MTDCGGCRGLGRHRRWCVAVVGRAASVMGRQAEQAEALADSVGPNHMPAANDLYEAAAALDREARRLAALWSTAHGTTH